MTSTRTAVALPKQAPRKRIGRPTKAPQSGERVQLGLRVSAATKQRLDDAARTFGSTQSREAERLIELSFVEQDALGGQKAQLLARAMGAAFAFAGQRAAAGKSDGWADDPAAYVAGAGAVINLLFMMLPEGEGHEIARQGLISRLLTKVHQEQAPRP
jgi:hypothetical protein